MRRVGGIFFLCLVFSGCSVIDAATGGDDDDTQCTHVACYRFTDTLSPPINVKLLATGDFDDDETADLVASDETGDIFLLLNDNNSPGSFTDSDLEADFTVAPEALAAGDINGDGFAEAVGSVFGAPGTVQVRGPAIAPFHGELNEPKQLLVARLNGDGFDDVLVRSTISSGDGLSLLFGRATSGFEPTVGEIEGSEGLQDFTTGDFDGDGDTDIAVVRDGSVIVYDNDGDGVYTVGTPFLACLINCPVNDTELVERIVAGDFDGDMRDDLAVHVYCPSGCTVPYEQIRFLEAVTIDSWQEFKNYSVFTPPVAGSQVAAVQLSVADMDLDGTDDVVWQERDEDENLGRVLLYSDFFNSGDPQIGHLEVNEPAVHTVLADFNVDGHLDIATATESGSIDIVFSDE